MSTTIQFHLPDITCINCVGPVETVLKQYMTLPEDSFSIDVIEKCVNIEIADINQTKAAISALITAQINTADTEPEYRDFLNKQLDVLRTETETRASIIAQINAADTEPEQRDLLKKQLDALHAETGISDVLKACINRSGTNCIDFEQVNEADNLSESIDKPVTTTSEKKKYKPIRTHFIKGLIGTTLGVGVMALMMSGVALPMTVMYALSIGCSALTLYLGKESYQDAWKSLTQDKKVTMDSLFAISTGTVVAISLASLFVPWLPMMMDAGLMVFGFRHLGKAIEASLKQNITKGLAFKDRGAKFVEKEMRIDNRVEWLRCETKAIVKNDVVRIKRGCTIPFDGTCEQDISLRSTILNGQDQTEIKRGEKILAGMKVPEDVPYIKMCVTAPEAQSYLARYDHHLLQAHAEKAPIEETTEHLLQYFVPAVLGISLVSGVAIGISFGAVAAIQVVATLLSSACPCTLGFITPWAVKIGITKAAENGVTFKNGKTLQAAAHIDTILLDLNGTITTGVPVVKEYYICTKQGIKTKDFYNYLQSIENVSKHLFAKAICQDIDKKNLNTNQKFKLTIIDKFRTGVRAKIEGEWVYAGNREFMAKHNIDISSLQQEISKRQHGEIVYLAKQNQLMGFAVLKDPLRKNARKDIEQLRKIIPDIRFCTGASATTAKYYAKKVNIPEDKIYSNCGEVTKNGNDTSKVSIIQQLQAEGKRVAMIGDAGNDTSPMAYAQFGIAVKSNASDEMTQREAGAIIGNDTLLPIVTAFAVAKETVKSINQNLAINLSYNAGTIFVAGAAVALGFALNPGIGAALMAIETSGILLNLGRVKKRQLAHLKAQPMTSEEWFSKYSYQYFQSHLQPQCNLDIAPQKQQENTTESIQSANKKSNFNWRFYQKPADEKVTVAHHANEPTVTYSI